MNVRNFFFLASLLIGTPALATVNVSFSSATPASMQKDFIANATNQYLATITPSLFFSNTYSLVIKGLNPAYTPPIPSTSTINWQTVIDNFVAQSTTTYLYGWANGQHYERFHDIGTLGYYIVNCSTPTAFSLVQSSTSTWNLGTCLDSLGTLNSAIYQQEFSTPTVINGY